MKDKKKPKKMVFNNGNRNFTKKQMWPNDGPLKPGKTGGYFLMYKKMRPVYKRTSFNQIIDSAWTYGTNVIGKNGKFHPPKTSGFWTDTRGLIQ